MEANLTISDTEGQADRPITAMPSLDPLNNIASCEVSPPASTRQFPECLLRKKVPSEEDATAQAPVEEPSAPDRPKVPAAEKTLGITSPLISVEAAIEHCKAARQIKGPLQTTKWGKKAFAVMAAALGLHRVLNGNIEAINKARAALKADGGRQRAHNSNNVALIAVDLCQTPGDQQDRKELSRFSTVVAFAIRMNVDAKDAEKWLSQWTLTAAVEAARALTRGSNNAKKRLRNPITSRKHPFLAEVMSSEENPQRDAVNAKIDLFMAELNRELSLALGPLTVPTDVESPSDNLSGGSDA